jgi:hypothetical protein
MKRRRRGSYAAMFQTLSARHLALTGEALTPRLVVTDFEVTHLNKTNVNKIYYVEKNCCF